MMFDNDFPVRMANPGIGFLSQYVSGFDEYNQAGESIPDFRLQEKYAQKAGGPLVDQTLISGTPSFDLNFPKMPGAGTEQKSIEGLPNATPELLRKYIERKMKNPGGQELPGFLKKA